MEPYFKVLPVIFYVSYFILFSNIWLYTLWII